MPLGLILLLVFIAVPIAEIAVFIQVGGLIGLVPTLLLVLLTALVGSVLIRGQGLRVLGQAKAEVDRGRPPVRELFTGLCLVVAGMLLLTPGFVTDTMGFLLLLPPVREALRRRLAKAIEVQVVRGAGGQGAARRRDVIEGEFEEVDPAAEALPPRGGWGRR
ncbi:MAG: FxsA family protein [Geminicoccaceae bacterium]|nr:FxsA family protein [Geminicoccaceae bacterium]